MYDINPEKLTLPRSKICCGQRAFLCKKPLVVIPYGEIAWVYTYEQGSEDIVVKTIVVYTKDGRKFSLNSDEYEFKWLLDNYIVNHSLDVIRGCGGEKKEYLQLNPLATKKDRKVKKILGVILICLAAFFWMRR